MHEVIKEIKSSPLGFIQEKIEKSIEELRENTENKRRISGDVDSGMFNGKEQLRIHFLTNNSDIWNDIINNLTEINETAIKDKLVGYQQQRSVRFTKDKETKLYKIILNTDTHSLHYCFDYRTNL